MSEKIKNVRYALMAMLLFFSAAVQAQTVKGNVKDATGEPIIGATIQEKGAKNAAVTDLDGNFTIKMASTSHDLTFSYIGMKSQVIKPGSKTELNVVLEDDNSALEEVVVVGYGSKARKDLTGSVGSISGAKLAAVPVSSASEALVGKIAGVQVTSVDGQPGADINIRVRGATSVTQSNEPLYIVDGFQQSNINDIPPSDIASIDVLKDASLTAIYGAKGANGVVVVTTKSAKAGKVQVSFNGRLTISHRTKKLDLLNTHDFVDYEWDRGVNYSNGKSLSFRENFGNPQDIDLYYNQNIDWQDEVMNETPISHLANVTIGGGNEKTQFNLSLSNTNDKGIIMGSGVSRTNLNFKINTNISNKLKFTYNPTFTYRKDDGAGGEGVGVGGIIDVLKYRPTAGYLSVASYDEKWMDSDTQNDFNENNPVANINTNVQYKHSYNLNNRMSLQWTPIPNLVLRTEGNYSITFRDTQRYYGALTSMGQKYNSQPVASVTNRTTQSYTWTNTASYSLELNDVHNMSFLLGQEIYNNSYKEYLQTCRYFDRSVDADRAFDNMSLGEAYVDNTYRSTPDRMASFFGQVSYNYDHKYFISATFRADGSTKFAPGNQWGYFPSISGAWDMKKENFLKDVKWIDQLKIRVAYGLAGNNGIDLDLWRYRYSMEIEGGPGFGESRQYGNMYYSAPSYYPNADLKWETTASTNLAADITLFDGRLTITPEIYWKTTSDLLYQSAISSTSGYSKQMQNIGKTTNNGWELSVNGDILRGRDYVLSANFNIAHNTMTVKELNATDDKLYNYSSRFSSAGQDDYMLEVGNEVGLFYGYVYDGLYTFDDFDLTTYKNKKKWVLNDGVAEMSTDVLPASDNGDPTMPGKIKFKDLNGDGKITTDDRTVIGRTTPKWQGGFGLSGQWKNFDFQLDFTYMLGFDVYNGTAYALSSSSSNSYTNVLGDFSRDNRWEYTITTGAHDDIMSTSSTAVVDYYNDYLAINANKTLWNPQDVRANTINSYFIEDGSFLRCQNLTIGYTLPKDALKVLGISKLRCYLSAGNLFILTGYTGYDPEVDIATGLTPNMDYNRYPRARTFSFGLNVTF